MNSSDFEHVQFDPGEFSGTVRMFPIPNLVMMPHVVQPLHIFEERYREMMADALADDRLIAMPVLKPGWEPEYAGRPPVQPWACLGKVVLHNKLPDGCYNLLLMGVGRLRIDRELDPLRSFRQASATLVSDRMPADNCPDSRALHKRLLKLFDRRLSTGEAPVSLKELVESDVTLAQLTDLMAYALPLACEQKLALLGEPCVATRARQLLDMLDAHAASRPAPALAAGFPPPFSVN